MIPAQDGHFGIDLEGTKTHSGWVSPAHTAHNSAEFYIMPQTITFFVGEDKSHLSFLLLCFTLWCFIQSRTFDKNYRLKWFCRFENPKTIQCGNTLVCSWAEGWEKSIFPQNMFYMSIRIALLRRRMQVLHLSDARHFISIAWIALPKWAPFYFAQT